MEIIKIKSNNYEIVVNKAFKVLQNGGIVVHPTDTCYGLAADFTNQQAVAKVYSFKKRNQDKPVNIIVQDEKQFKIYGEWQPIISELISKNKKRMCSFVVKKTEKVPSFFNPDFESIGIQIPKHPFSLRLLKKIKVPLVATSANISGHPNVYSISTLIKQLKNRPIEPGLIIDAGRLPYRKVSMVIEILKNDEYRILRK